MSVHDTAPTGLTIEEVRAVARRVAIATAELIAEKYDSAWLWHEREKIGDQMARTFVGCELEEPEWTRGPHTRKRPTDDRAPTAAPEALLAWRESEGLTQARAASLAGVKLRAWQRWEYGEREVPQWLSDTLTVRWGNGP